MDPNKCVIHGPKAIHVELGRFILNKIANSGSNQLLKGYKLKKIDTEKTYTLNFMDVVDHYIPPESDTDSEDDDDIECLSDDES